LEKGEVDLGDGLLKREGKNRGRKKPNAAIATIRPGGQNRRIA